MINLFDIIQTIVILILAFIVLVVPIFMTLINVIRVIGVFTKKHIIGNKLSKRLKNTDVWTLFFGLVLSTILWNILEFKDYTKSLMMNYDTSVHSPIQQSHMISILLIIIAGTISYLTLRFRKTKISPIGIVICLGLIVVTNCLGITIVIQLSKNIMTIDSAFEPINPIFYLSLLPINYLLCTIKLMKDLVSDFAVDFYQVKYSGNLISKINTLIIKANRWIWLSFVIAVPLLVILIIISTLFGQEPNSLIKAFTETSDWSLSQKISPPPIEYDGHYLCTVSLKGHKKLVRPKRCGIRRGQKIIVNRQLMIANAFEEVIQERMPIIHKYIRSFYDKYGFPLSRLITSTIAADVVYILMKPLELVFLLFIYAMDIKPEDRIQRQYLPNIRLLETSVVNIS